MKYREKGEIYNWIFYRKYIEYMKLILEYCLLLRVLDFASFFL